MDGLGWIVGGYLAYVGLAIGAALFVALGIAVVRGQRRMRDLEQRLARAEMTTQRAVAVREQGSAPPSSQDDEAETLIPTPLGGPRVEEPGEQVDREMFWDLLLRESVVRAASISHGVRAVLSPGTRNRIRFEVRQETKRARKQRRAEERAAVRQLRQDRLEDAS